MALFGAPVAHEDDPERAVRAALTIRDRIAQDDGLQVRIAVTTGEALVSLSARPAEGEGMASGDVVNTASRLQSAAPTNGILVDETTYRATALAIEYREAEPVEAKGKAEPVAVWEAVEPRWRFGVDVEQAGGADLVGRSEELDLLTDALARARRERASQLVTLVGVPGIGKSRLVFELSRVVDDDPELIYWRQGRSLPYGEGVTFWALSDMVKAHASILETDDAADAERKLRAAVAEVISDPIDVDWALGHLKPLVGLGAEADASGDRRAEVFAAWRKFFEALAERGPLVLVFDDLQWADDGLLDFVDHLVEWASGVPLMCVCTARPELLERRPGWGGGKRNATTISLSPLSESETAKLIGLLMERSVLPAELQSALLARAGGNPALRGGVRPDGAGPRCRGGGGAAGVHPGHHRRPARRAHRRGKGRAAGRRRAGQGRLGRSPRRHRRACPVDGGGAAARAGAQGIRPPRAALVGRRRDRVRVPPHPRPRRCLQPDSSLTARTEAPSRSRVDRVARPRGGARGAARAPLPRGARVREGDRPRPGRPRRAREVGPARGGLARLRARRARGGDPFLRGGARAVAGGRSRPGGADGARSGGRLVRRANGSQQRALAARDAARAAGRTDLTAEAELLLANVYWYQGDHGRSSTHLAAARALAEDLPLSRTKAHVLAQVSRFHMLSSEAEPAVASRPGSTADGRDARPRRPPGCCVEQHRHRTGEQRRQERDRTSSSARSRSRAPRRTSTSTGALSSTWR